MGLARNGFAAGQGSAGSAPVTTLGGFGNDPPAVACGFAALNVLRPV